MVVRAKGINCEVELFDHHILIKRTGLFAAGSRLGGDKSVPLSSITSVQFRRAGMFSPGFVKFGILGEADPGWDKLIHPNVVGFRSSQQMAFLRIRDAIQASINVPSLAALASQHVRARSEEPALDADAGRAYRDTQKDQILEGAPSPRLAGPAPDRDIDAELVVEPDWNAWGQRLKFLLRMAGYSFVLFLFLGLTGLGRQLEGFDSVTLFGMNFRLITPVVFIAVITALISPIVRMLLHGNGSRFSCWVNGAPRISVATIIFAVPMILVTGGPSPYQQDRAPDRAILEQAVRPPASAVDLVPKKRPTSARVASADDWSGHYEGTFDNATGGIDISRAADGKLSIAIGMAGASCAGGIDAIVDRPDGDVITVTKAPYEDGDHQESSCRVSLQKQGDALAISEDEVCMNHHGMSCGFQGTARRSK
nr:hypothetical protein [Sphingomonas sp. Y57]